MSDLDRILKLAGREAQEQAQDLTNEREMKAAEVCGKCGCDTANPVEGCECSHDETNEAVGDFAEPIYDLCDELGCDADHPVLADLIRYLDGDTIKDFVADFRRHNDMGMDEAAMSDEDKERAMKRAMQSADEPERGEKKKKVTLKKAPWEEVSESADTFVGINTKTGDFESGLSHEEVTSGRFTHMLADNTTYFDPDTAEELVGAPDEEMEAMGWEKVPANENAFNQAAAAAARAGEDSFEFGGKTHKTTMKKDTAHKLDEGGCSCCGCSDSCGCPEDCSGCDCNSAVNEAPTMDTTQMITLMRNAGLSEDTIDAKLNEWANSAAGAADEESTSYGEPYENFAQAVNLSLKRYLDAEDMKVQVSEHKVEDMKALYESKKSK